jgi:hypothetical protein
MLQSYREKTVAYSSRRNKFVNVFDHPCLAGMDPKGRKRVDSFDLWRKLHSWLFFEQSRCGKPEESVGKKGNTFRVPPSKKPATTSRTQQHFFPGEKPWLTKSGKDENAA